MGARCSVSPEKIVPVTQCSLIKMSFLFTQSCLADKISEFFPRVCYNSFPNYVCYIVDYGRNYVERTFLSAELFPQPNCFGCLLRFLCFFFQFISNCPGAESPNLQLTLLERMLTVKASGGSLPKALQFPLWGCV